MVCFIGIDLGTSKSGYSYAFSTESGAKGVHACIHQLQHLLHPLQCTSPTTSRRSMPGAGPAVFCLLAWGTSI